MIDWSKVDSAAARAARDLAQRREAAVLTTAEFAIRSMKAGYISKQDAMGWITGRQTPSIVNTALATITNPVARDEAEMRILGAVEVHRTSPFVALLQAILGLTDAQVDSLFGL